MDFQDPPSDDHITNNSLETSNLKCKLESKSKALVILSTDLVECKRERDEYKLMAEQLRDRYTSLKRRISCYRPAMEGIGTHHSLVHEFEKNSPLSHVLLELTEQNKYLLFEVEELKTKLVDSEGDLKMLREQLRSHNYGRSDGYSSYREIDFYGRDTRSMEDVVAQLEDFRNKVSLMEKDLHSILDEKEELILSRDGYKRKTERLNLKLNQILSSRAGGSNDGPIVTTDIDGLERENQFLRDKLKQTEEEKKLTQAMMTKYKGILNENVTSSPKGQQQQLPPNVDPMKGLDSLLDGTGSSGSGSNLQNVITTKQVKQFIEANGLNQLEVSPAAINRLRNLVLAMYESLVDKQSALNLHKKNNKLLGRRINELEDKLRKLNTEKVLMLTKGDQDMFPSGPMGPAGGANRGNHYMHQYSDDGLTDDVNDATTTNTNNSSDTEGNDEDEDSVVSEVSVKENPLSFKPSGRM